jgi:SAM-dependent methyltransferase
MDSLLLVHDTRKTLQNREKLAANKNLLYWYQMLYQEQFKTISDIPKLRILEIGSGTSPLKLFYPNVLTSDIMDLYYLDYVLDAHEVDVCSSVEDCSLDIITMTNVLHHLKDPISVLEKASTKLKQGGRIIFVEPFFSLLSKVIFVYFHHEPTDFQIKQPTLDIVDGPLSSANIALPFLIFKNKWDAPLNHIYDSSDQQDCYFSSISYMLTGGISRALNIPHCLYKLVFHIDLFLSRHFPKLFASFFICQLIKRQDHE